MNARDLKPLRRDLAVNVKGELAYRSLPPSPRHRIWRLRECVMLADMVPRAYWSTRPAA